MTDWSFHLSQAICVSYSTDLVPTSKLYFSRDILRSQVRHHIPAHASVEDAGSLLEQSEDQYVAAAQCSKQGCCTVSHSQNFPRQSHKQASQGMSAFCHQRAGACPIREDRCDSMGSSDCWKCFKIELLIHWASNSFPLLTILRGSTSSWSEAPLLPYGAPAKGLRCLTALDASALELRTQKALTTSIAPLARSSLVMCSLLSTCLFFWSLQLDLLRTGPMCMLLTLPQRELYHSQELILGCRNTQKSRALWENWTAKQQDQQLSQSDSRPTSLASEICMG